MAWRLETGTDLVIELHLLPGKTPIAVEPVVGLFFDKAAPTQVPLMLKMGSKAIDIPAGQSDYAIEDTLVLPVDVDLLSVYPHAHYLGHEMRVQATLPDGTTRSLLHIKHWSFHWQHFYWLEEPVTVKGGDQLKLECHYDTTGDSNRVGFCEGTECEMCVQFAYVTQ
jgi:hypothetical protein